MQKKEDVDLDGGVNLDVRKIRINGPCCMKKILLYRLEVRNSCCFLFVKNLKELENEKKETMDWYSEENNGDFAEV